MSEQLPTTPDQRKHASAPVESGGCAADRGARDAWHVAGREQGDAVGTARAVRRREALHGSEYHCHESGSSDACIGR